MVTAFVIRVAVVSLVLSATALAQQQGSDIPFDTNVPETNAGTGAENAPPPPAAPADNTNLDSGPPPPAMAQPAPSVNKKDELSGTPPADTGNGAPPPPPPAQPGPAPVAGKRRQIPAELSGLGKLAPFSDIAVISKRFLPKTHRFEFFPNFGLIMNDAFFSDVVLGARLGFYFNENWGIEATGATISTSQKQVTNELQSSSNYGVQTTALSTPTSYFGADVKWIPIYGKVGFMNKSIVPFDFYFSLGGGVTGTGTGSAPTFHLGAGQIFAINKWLAGRWDISWYEYSATSVGGGSSLFPNLHATIGVSIFFPEAAYR